MSKIILMMPNEPAREVRPDELRKVKALSYNGHKNWTHWNVSLWLHNTEEWYDLMNHAIIMTPNRREAALWVLHNLPEKTPDGARYSFTAVRAAMVGF